MKLNIKNIYTQNFPEDAGIHYNRLRTVYLTYSYKKVE